MDPRHERAQKLHDSTLVNINRVVPFLLIRIYLHLVIIILNVIQVNSFLVVGKIAFLDIFVPSEVEWNNILHALLHCQQLLLKLIVDKLS